MERERTPVEARGAVVSGRVIVVLIVSFVGAAAALGVSWLVLAGSG